MQDYLLEKQRPVFGLKAILLTVGLHAAIGVALYLTGSKTPEPAVADTPTTQAFPTQSAQTKPLAKQTKLPNKPVKYP